MSDSIGYTVYTQAGRKCPWCDKAIALLTQKGLGFNAQNLSRSAIPAVAAKAKMSSVPIIYHGVRLVGGYQELVAYLDAETNT